jgi:hypothetical protein
MAMKKKQRSAPRLTEKQAWTVIAEMFKDQGGLCRAVWLLREAKLISYATERRLNKTIGAYRLRHRINNTYFWPRLAPSRDEFRIAFALAAAKKAKR